MENIKLIQRCIGRLALLLIAVTLLPYQILAQGGFPVTGKIYDSKGEPVVGATVMEKGTTKGVFSGIDGSYSIEASSGRSTLVFSFVGLSTVEKDINGKSSMNVTMDDNAEELDEVVVIGYGVVKKSDLTGSVSSISKDAVNDRVVTSIEDALKGRAAGVQITVDDGAPGSSYTLRIRGASSVNASSAPLYIIDGVPSEPEDISPGDVASIEILKDASATAIYGSRGANGVILVTTKRGAKGKTKVDFSSIVGVQQATRPYDLMDAKEYQKMRYRASWVYKDASASLSSSEQANYTRYYDGQGGSWLLPNSGLERYAFNEYSDSINTDWQDLMYRNAIIQEYRLTVSGGTDRTRFSVMGNYSNQDGIIVHSGVEKFSGRLNLTQDLSSKVRMTANVSITKTDYKGISTGSSDGVTTNMLRRPPTDSPETGDYDNVDDPSNISGAGASLNPYYQAKHITMDRFRHVLVAKLGIDYNINKYFIFRATGSYDYRNDNNDYYYPKTVVQGFKQNGRNLAVRNMSNKLLGESFLYYNRTFFKMHKVSAMVGATVEQYTLRGVRTENQNFVFDNLGVYAIGEGTTPVIPTSSYDRWRMASFLGRLNYSYDEKYLLTATFRADGSSRFGANNKWGMFPSVALAWKASEEEFIKQLGIFSELKVRGSFGISGNTAIPAYRTLSTISTAFMPMNGDSEITYGVKTDRPENGDLKWETTSQYDVGIDFGFFKNRITLVADAYLKTTKDLLLEMNVPRYSGYEKSWANMGKIQNKGLEFTLGAVIVENRDFRWYADFNIGINRSKVIDIGPGGEWTIDPLSFPQMGSIVLLRNGESLGQWYGFKTDGVWKDQAEIDASPIISQDGTAKANITPGMVKMVDVNGDNIVDENDKTKLGSGEPLFSGGFSTSIGYKGFDLTVGFQYSYGTKVFNVNRLPIEVGTNGYNNTAKVADSWRPSLYDEFDVLFEEGNPNSTTRFPGRISQNRLVDTYIEDGSYLRVSDITLSYTFPKAMMQKLRIEGLKLFVSGKNLWVFTKYTGYDPEVNTRQGGYGDLMPSLDYGAYPRARTFSAGLNIIF